MSRLRDTLAQRAQNSNGALSDSVSIRRLLSSESVKKRFEELLGKKAPGFMSSILNIVNGNTNLQECNPQQVLAAAAVAASLDLPIDPNLGFAYIVPYKGKAQFQMGYRGYIQLAMRTGLYQTINATEVYEGEIRSHNRITGLVEFDPDGRTSDQIVGFVAYFRLLNGFEKYDYMTVDEVVAHAKRFSQSFNSNHSPWKTDFNAMATKTVLKRLLSKYGILSIEMQTGLSADQAVVTESDEGDPTFEYVDNSATLDAEYTVSHDEPASDELTDEEKAAILAAEAAEGAAS